MADGRLEPEELRGFAADARRAVTLAEVEACGLGHDRVGTEHLLLGLLANDGSGAAKVLSEAGVTIAAARHKVSEAVGGTLGDSSRLARPLPRTARAARALGRSVRFSHARHADAVASEHVLLGVLDVEGNAGQVLRGLGLDVERLRSSLEVLDLPSSGQTAAGDEFHATPVTCPSCTAPLDDVAYRDVLASGDGGARQVTLFSCGACGALLGIT
ncbi:MAG: Clp protease N-terminal domain-containing protein [Acidimicrobiales bacterium]